jgi:uncharacterized protein (DUF488 family)
MSGELFTIGHSNHTINAFIALLQGNAITRIADMRSYPYSRYVPQFNKSELKTALDRVGIRYVFLGCELGGRTNTTGCYDLTGKTLQDTLENVSKFSQGIDQILEDVQREKIALMCAERDPLTCHRTILVCQYLRHPNLKIQHIWPDGSLESHAHLQERLVQVYGLPHLEAIARKVPGNLNSPSDRHSPANIQVAPGDSPE